MLIVCKCGHIEKDHHWYRERQWCIKCPPDDHDEAVHDFVADNLQSLEKISEDPI